MPTSFINSKAGFTFSVMLCSGKSGNFDTVFVDMMMRLWWFKWKESSAAAMLLSWFLESKQWQRKDKYTRERAAEFDHILHNLWKNDFQSSVEACVSQNTLSTWAAFSIYKFSPPFPSTTPPIFFLSLTYKLQWTSYRRAKLLASPASLPVQSNSAQQ